MEEEFQPSGQVLPFINVRGQKMGGGGATCGVWGLNKCYVSGGERCCLGKGALEQTGAANARILGHGNSCTASVKGGGER